MVRVFLRSAHAFGIAHASAYEISTNFWKHNTKVKRVGMCTSREDINNQHLNTLIYYMS